jgi:hypothetical protein
MKKLRLAIASIFTAVPASCEKPIPNPSHTVIPQFSDDWKLVEVRQPDSDEIWMFRKNMGVSEIKGLKALPTLVYFTVQFDPKDTTGLPSKEDAQVLYDFEEEVIPNVEKEAACVLVASVVKGGVKDHLFYVTDPDLFMKALSAHREALGDFRVSLEKHDDPAWAVYDDFPEGN